MNISKMRKNILSIALGIYFATLLWITLLSRIGEFHRSIGVPLQSFRNIGNGDQHALVETLENVFLFIPLGFFCRRLFGLRRIRTQLIGLMISVLIEAVQWIFGLGTIEIDDCITNTVGVTIGALVSNGNLEMGKIGKHFVVIIVSFMISLSLPLLGNEILYRQMRLLAANGNKEEKQNILILNGYPGYVGSTNVFVGYHSDGSISISGTSNYRAWKLIGQITLPPGRYSFSGLCGTKEHSIAIELEYYNEEQNNYIRLTPDIGPIGETIFELEKETRIKAYVSVYAGAEGYYMARPVIYRED